MERKDNKNATEESVGFDHWQREIKVKVVGQGNRTDLEVISADKL